MIVLNDVKKIYHMGEFEVQALRGVSTRIDDGEFVAIMGPSGSGKSTLMNILGCLDSPTFGSYRLDDIEVAGMTEDELAAVRNRKIGFVFQSFNLLPRLSAVEQVELPLAYARTPNRRKLAAAALESVGLGQRIHHKPTELSGGQQQRVAIARALVTQPSMILADEPTGNLDTRASEEIMALFQRLNDDGITVVFVTHEPDIASHTRRVILIRDGLITSDDRFDGMADTTRRRAITTAVASRLDQALDQEWAASRNGRSHASAPAVPVNGVAGDAARDTEPGLAVGASRGADPVDERPTERVEK